MTEVEKILSELDIKITAREQLWWQLRKSVAMKALWLDVFANGAATSAWVKPAGKRIYMGTHKLGEEWKGFTFRITDGADEVREYAWRDVPLLLGGGLNDAAI